MIIPYSTPIVVSMFSLNFFSKSGLIEHLSEGNLNADWLKDSIKIHKKWKGILPKSIQTISRVLKKRSDYNSCDCVLNIDLHRPGNLNIVLKHYSKIMFKYFSLNKFLYTKTVFKYIFSSGK